MLLPPMCNYCATCCPPDFIVPVWPGKEAWQLLVESPEHVQVWARLCWDLRSHCLKMFSLAFTGQSLRVLSPAGRDTRL